MNALSSEALDCLPSLKDKFLVDFVNGIDVARDQISVQKGRMSFFNRLSESLTGKARARQQHVNEQLVNGLEGSLRWLNDLTEELTFTNHALKRTTNELASLKNNVATLTNFSADTREMLNSLTSHVSGKFERIEANLRSVDMRQRAFQHIDRLISRWRTGHYNYISVAEHCYAILNELAWGDCGDYLRQCEIQSDREEVLQYLKTELVNYVNESAGGSSRKRYVLDNLLKPKEVESITLVEDVHQSLSYLGSCLSLESQPLMFFVSQKNIEVPVSVPLIMSANRLVEKMMDEVTKKGVMYV